MMSMVHNESQTDYHVANGRSKACALPEYPKCIFFRIWRNGNTTYEVYVYAV